MGHISPRQWRSSTTKHQPGWIGRLFPLALSLLTMLQITAAQAANPTIEAILGGGTVLGTECVNGKVVESLYQSNATFTEFGPEATLYVQSTEKAGVGVKTRLRRTAGNGWTDNTDYRQRDSVVFNPIAGGTVSNLKHYLVKGTGVTTDAERESRPGGFFRGNGNPKALSSRNTFLRSQGVLKSLP